jgi:hypothetical protein
MAARRIVSLINTQQPASDQLFEALSKSSPSGRLRALSHTKEERLQAVSWAPRRVICPFPAFPVVAFSTLKVRTYKINSNGDKNFRSLRRSCNPALSRRPEPQIATAQPGAPSSAAPTAQNSDPGSLLRNAPHGTPEQSLHLRHPHHLQVGAGNDSEEGSNSSPEIANPGNAESAAGL